MKKKRKLKKKVIVLIVLIIILISSIIGFILFKSFDKETNHAKVIDEIPEYGYTLEEDQPEIYKKLFKELVKVLSEEEVDEEKYAELISQMFAIDFYNLDNKVSKNDIGGTQFVMEDYIDNFVLEASDTVYKYVEQNIYGDREQSLPIVSSSSVKSIENDKYSFEEIKDDNVYVVTVTLGYENDMDYPEEVIVKLLHSDKKLEVYEMK